MGALMILPALALAAVPPPSLAAPDRPAAARALPAAVVRWHAFTAEASQRFGIPEDWIVAVMAAESGGRTTLHGRPIVSPAGAMGLMQVMPATWATMRARYDLGSDPHDPRANILSGTAYLRLMYDRFGYPGLFGAYNAGPARYAAHLASGRPLPGETCAYVARLADRPATPAMPPAILSGERLFVPLRGAATADRDGQPMSLIPPNDGLFVPLAAPPGRDR